jgi:PAS domain S-box-containing protein
MSWSHTIYAFLLIISALAATLLSIYAWQRRQSSGLTGFLLLTLSAAHWSAGYALELMSTSHSAILFWAKLEYLGIAILPVGWLLFAAQYSGRDKWLQRRNPLFLSLIPLLTMLLVFTNEWHGLIWREVSLLDGPGGSRLFTPTYGPWFWIQWAYAYLCLSIGTFFLLTALGRFSRLYRPQALSLLAGIATPWLGNLLYILDVSPFDLTPIAFSVSAIWLSWSVFRFRLLAVVPVAYAQVYTSMVEGVIVLDLNNRIVDANPAAERVIGLPLSQLIGQPAAALPVARPDLVERFANVMEASAEITLGQGLQERHYQLRISPLLNPHGHPAGRLVIVHDMTDRVKARRRLLAQYAVTRTLAEADTVLEAIPEILRAVCHHLVWERAEFWLLEGTTPPQKPLASWPESPEMPLLAPELPAQVCDSGKPIINTSADGITAGIPIAIGPKVLAVFTFLGRTADPADESLWQTMYDIADQVAQFLVRTQAEERLQRQNAYLAALNETALALMNRLELEELLEAIVAQAGRLLNTPHGYIYLVEPDGQEIEAKIGLGVLRSLVGLRLRPGEGVAGKVWQTGRLLAVDDYSHWPERVEHVGQPFHAVVGVPLRTASQVAGVIGLVRLEPGSHFEDHEIRLLSRFAQLAAIALDNARLYQAAQAELNERKRAESRQAVFAGLAQALNPLTTAEKAAHVIVNAAAQLIGWDACALNLYVPSQDRLYHVLAMDTIAGRQQQVPAGNASDTPSPTARRVITEGPQLILRQVAQSSADFTTFGDKSRPSASLMFVPIHHGSQVSGILTIQSYTPNAYTEEDLATLQALADHASSALDRIRATEELRAQKQLFEGLVTVARALAEQPDLEASLRNVLNVATTLTAAHQGDLFLLDEAGRVTHNLITGTDLTANTIKLARQAVSDGLAGWVVRAQQAALIADVEEDPRWLSLPVPGESPRSALCVPILGRQTILGVLTLLHPTPGHFTHEQFHLMVAATEQMALALENARQHSQLMALVESSRDGIALFGSNGRLLVLNTAALTILGLPGEPAAWINRTLPEMLLSLRRSAPALARTTLAKLRQLVSGPDLPTEGEFELPPQVAHWFTLPIHVGDVPFGQLLVLRDVTEERMLARLRQDLMQTLVHDLRNPLIAIFGAVELLVHVSDMPPPQQQQMIGIVQQNATRMSDLINTIMDIGRLESQQMPMSLEPVALDKVVAETFHLQSPLLNARQLQADCQVPSDLAPAWGDARLVRRILQNLIGNAIKFTSEGGWIRVTAEETISADSLPTLLVTVQDNGPGIPVEIAPRLFQKFVTGPQVGRGSGLGLAFCRLAVEAQGGRIWVDSEAGQGTTILFTLPQKTGL